jgi:hypothetical protein
VNSEVSVRGFDVNNVPVDEDAAKMRYLSTSSLQVEVPLHQAIDQEGAEDEENGGVGGGVRKKLRLSKAQSAFLEDSFKERSILTPVCVLSYSNNHICVFLCEVVSNVGLAHLERTEMIQYRSESSYIVESL